MIDRAELELLLARLLKSGRMKRLPKSHKEQKIFVALAASILDPRKAYNESELNEHLADWLSAFVRTNSLDHVTVRRYMVDLGFLLRDPEGRIYRTNQAVIGTVITPAARMVQPAQIFEEQSILRAQRRHAHEIDRR